MRSDMDKVIVERPRIGSRANNDQKGELKLSQRALEREDLLPKRGSTSRYRRSGYKSFNEHLGPLRRFLNARCGKNWNKVYSEIRERISPTSTLQMHVLQHVSLYVQTQVKAWPDGTFTDAEGKRIRAGWFVDPKTGRLQKNPDSYFHGGRKTSNSYASRTMRRREPEIYVRRAGRFFREIGGIWYEVELRPVDALRRVHPNGVPYSSRNGLPDPPVYDAILKGQPTFDELLDEHGSYSYAASTRQLNSAEIRRYGLRAAETRLPDSPTRR